MFSRREFLITNQNVFLEDTIDIANNYITEKEKQAKGGHYFLSLKIIIKLYETKNIVEEWRTITGIMRNESNTAEKRILKLRDMSEQIIKNRFDSAYNYLGTISINYSNFIVGCISDLRYLNNQEGGVRTH